MSISAAELEQELEFLLPPLAFELRSCDVAELELDLGPLSELILLLPFALEPGRGWRMPTLALESGQFDIISIAASKLELVSG